MKSKSTNSSAAHQHFKKFVDLDAFVGWDYFFNKKISYSPTFT
jgi:hypothetical protein